MTYDACATSLIGIACANVADPQIELCIIHVVGSTSGDYVCIISCPCSFGMAAWATLCEDVGNRLIDFRT